MLRRLLGSAGLLVLLLAFAPLGAPAQAAVIHEFLPAPSEETSKGVPAEGPSKAAVPVPGKLGRVNSITVDSGGLYVAERSGAGSRVDRFDASSGAFASQFAQVPALEELEYGIAVGHDGGERVYVGAVNAASTEGAVAVFGADGDLLSTWEGADTPDKSFGPRGVTAVAVDDSASGSWSNGDVFVADLTEDAVDVFDPATATTPGAETAPVARLTDRELGVPLEFSEVPLPALTVDRFNGDLLVVDGGDAIDVFQPTGVGEFTLVRRITQTLAGALQGVTEVAADAGNGDIYVAAREAGLVYQFSVTGEYLDQLAGTPSAGFTTVNGLAVDPASRRVYVGDERSRRGVVDVFGPSLVVPDVTTGAASEETPASATLNGTVNPAGAGAASCLFDWGETEALGKTASCEPDSVANGPAPVAVKAGIAGLQPDRTYFYRLQASNGQGTDLGEGGSAECEGHASVDACFTTPGPGIEDESVTDVTAESAKLQATIDPDSVLTSYYFQYGSEACTSAAVACENAPAAPGSSLGSGSKEVQVSPQYLEDLLPGTVYHYRVATVAELTPGGEPETFFGPEQTFTTQLATGASGAGGLPDDRAWELVSSPDKHGANLEPVGNGALIQASADGDEISYAANAPTEAQPQGNANLVQILAGRGQTGWTSRDIAIPHETATGPAVGEEGEYRFFSADLASAIVQPFGPLDAQLSGEASEPTAYLATDYLNGNPLEPCPKSCFRPLVSASNVPAGTVFGEQFCSIHGGTELACGPTFVGATPDLSHVVLQSKVALTEEGGSEGFGGLQFGGLYEWAAGKLALVTQLPKNEGGAAVGAQLGYQNEDARHTVSSNGSRVIWEAESSSGKHLYLRDTATKETVRLDTPLPGVETGAESAPRFQDASSDGSMVFFTDAEALTEDSGANGVTSDLYECEVRQGPGGLECVLKDLTPIAANEGAADVVGDLIGVSEDGSCYFVANGVLAPGAKQGSCEGAFTADTTCNLYVSHDGTTKLIAALAGTDSPDWSSGEASLARLTAGISPDGRWLAFMSNRSLTGYDTSDSGSAQPDEEVYLYSAAADGGAGATICASCNPSGQRPAGVEYGPTGENMPLVGTAKIWESDSWLAAALPGWTSYLGFDALHQSRYLSNNGRLFFNGDDALVPKDVNGTWDVYEYEPPGVGSCATTQSTFSVASQGCVGLISSGESLGESVFLDASAAGGRDPSGAEGGGDVFFLTSAQLARQDVDTSLDVYDAHECTSASPCPPAASTQPPPCDDGESCRPAPTPQPEIYGTSGSATFSGAGNLGGRESNPPLKSIIKPRSKPLTRAQKLTEALKTCKRKPKKQRAMCEKRARKTYGVVKKSSRKTRK